MREGGGEQNKKKKKINTGHFPEAPQRILKPNHQATEQEENKELKMPLHSLLHCQTTA